MFITNINQLHEIGKDLKWRTTYLESASLPVTRLYEARGRRSRAHHRSHYSFYFLKNLFIEMGPPMSEKQVKESQSHAVPPIFSQAGVGA